MGTISKHSEDWWIEGACSTTSARLVNFPLFETQKEITAGHCEASKSYCPSHKIRVSPDENRVFPR